MVLQDAAEQEKPFDEYAYERLDDEDFLAHPYIEPVPVRVRATAINAHAVLVGDCGNHLRRRPCGSGMRRCSAKAWPPTAAPLSMICRGLVLASASTFGSWYGSALAVHDSCLFRRSVSQLTL